MSRGLWFLTGAGAGIYAALRGRRLAEALTAEGLGDRLHALALGSRLFAEDVAAGSAEMESQLRGRLDVVPHGSPQIASPDGTTDTATDEATDKDGSS